MGVRLRNWDFLGVEDFLKHFAAAKRGRGEGGSAKWHSCAKRVFCRGGDEAAKSFCSHGAISQRVLGGCEIISQPRDHGFFRLLSSS